jgi:exopolyphosphatase/guanosine-5'-triphosphate,3'-diphosphate pyrophosphatase
MECDPKSAAPATGTIVAAIDVGANSLRMVVAEVLPDGHVEVLERLQRAVRLGQDVFRRGRLGAASMRTAVAILRDFREVLKLYSVERVRAVATSAAREASNSDTFLDRVTIATGLKVEVIGTPEESRLTVSAVREALGDALHVREGEALIADVGGGSTLLTLLKDGEILASQSLRLGAIRLNELVASSSDSPERTAELLTYQISSILGTLQNSFSLRNVQSFIAVGGDARFAAHQVGQGVVTNESDHAGDLFVIEPSRFDEFVDRCEQWTSEEVAKRFGIPFAEAETVNSALLVYKILFRMTRAKQIIVSSASMRDGLLLELAQAVTGCEDHALAAGVIQSTIAIAKKYHIDLRHAKLVADLAGKLFDELQPEHGLGSRQRLLLTVASLLHEIGGFVSNRSHHKHSFYLIANSEIYGLNRDDTAIAAHVARYHRRSGPKPSHLEYMSLPRETRVTVNKLAALLRVADGLSRGHLPPSAEIKFERQGDDLIICIRGVDDLVLEERAVAAKSDLFEDIYGMKVRVEAI